MHDGVKESQDSGGVWVLKDVAAEADSVGTGGDGVAGGS